MTIDVRDCVYGDIRIININDSDERILSDNHNNNILIKVGDKVVYANKSMFYKIIRTGTITGFDKQDPSRVHIGGISVSVPGEAYIGVLNPTDVTVNLE